ncbi:HET-domain-containing protein, partial [Melanomma pulvis-pyrius CBS 109.77]
IHCCLEKCSLVEKPSYRALSYCWGDPMDTRAITVNDQIVKVTTNLEAALRQLKSRGFTKIWIDALCINQNDILERGLQVLRMGLIYSNALQVMAWLGPAETNNPREEDFFGTSENLRHHHIFSRPFWRRIWIVQEIAKAQSIEILYGDMMISWEEFNLRAPTSLIPPEISALKTFREHEIIQKTLGKRRQALCTALNSTLSFQASDKRDKIYALLGLTSDGAEIVPMPNYSQDEQDVFFEVTKAILLRHKEFAYL